MLQSKSNMTRSISIAITVIFLLVSILASTESVSAASKLKVTVTKKTIYVGQTIKFKANKSVKWSVSKKKVAKLTNVKKKSVKVKGLKAGTTYVIAKSGKQTKKIKIVVKSKAPKKINIVASKDTIGLGEYCSVIVKSVKPSSASSAVVYSSSDKSIAYVNSNGLVMGLGEGTATITVKSKYDKSVKASVKINVIPAMAGFIHLNVDLSDEERYPAGKTAKVWLAIPQNDDCQFITAVTYDAPAAANAEVTYDSCGGKQLYVEWDENTDPADRKATLSYHIYRRASVNDGTFASKEKGTVDTAAFAEDLKETTWSGSFTSGIVKETADKIVADAGATTVYDKAYAIYDWVCDNIVRIDDKTVIFGEVEKILSGERLSGSCMDVNSVFVALCRAEGIPARNMFGLRFSPACGMNCRASFYLPGYGWLIADPALAIKQSWGHESDYIGDDAPENAIWEGIKDKYWINAQENWICLNMGRDVTLTPPQSAGTGEYQEVVNPDGSLNIYMFPYGEYDGQYISCLKGTNFKYEYSYDEEDPTDCGC